MASPSAVILVVGTAVAIREYNDWKAPHKTGTGLTLVPVYGGFLCGVVFLGIDAANSEIATLLLLIFGVTSILGNGSDLIGAIDRSITK